MSEAGLTYEQDGDVAVLRMDDGKANALSPALIQAIDEALDRASNEAGAVVLTGRPGRFSAGFDLSIMTGGAEPATALITQGAHLLMRLYSHPQPVVCACTGHALAAGALVLLSADTRIGASGDFKLGLNEVAIGMRLPVFAVELARDRLSKRHLTAAGIQGRIYGPEDARDVGFLDRVVDEGAVLETAMAEARALAGLSRGAYRVTKELIRGRTIEYVRETLDHDMANIAPPAK